MFKFEQPSPQPHVGAKVHPLGAVGNRLAPFPLQPAPDPRHCSLNAFKWRVILLTGIIRARALPTHKNALKVEHPTAPPTRWAEPPPAHTAIMAGGCHRPHNVIILVCCVLPILQPDALVRQNRIGDGVFVAVRPRPPAPRSLGQVHLLGKRRQVKPQEFRGRGTRMVPNPAPPLVKKAHDKKTQFVNNPYRRTQLLLPIDLG